MCGPEGQRPVGRPHDVVGVPWIASTVVLGGCIFLSYAVVLFDAFGDYPLPQGATSYVDSPYWLGLRRSSATAVAVFQLLAAAGYLMWVTALAWQRPVRGLLADPRWLVFANSLFLTASVAWPFAARRVVLQPTSLPWAVAASACLWVAAAGVLMLVGGTFEDDRESPLALVGILLTSTVVVVADGAGWSAAALHGALHPAA